MPKAIVDELTSLPISRQHRYQLRKRRDGKCIRCGQDAGNQGYFCEPHRQVFNVAARELQRKRFDLKHRYHESESYSFSCSTGRQLFDAAKTYLKLGRSSSPPREARAHLRIALLIGFGALEAYLNAVTENLDTRSNPAVPIERRIERLFSKFSTEPLDSTSSYWREFNSAMKLRNELLRPNARSRIDLRATERALDGIWDLINALNNGIYGSRWA